MAQLRTVVLYGQLRSRFGRRFQFLLESNATSEALQALCSQVAGFRAFLTQAKDRGMGFAIFVGKKNLKEHELAEPHGNDDIRIAPMLLGSKNGGVFNIILGAILILAASYFGGPEAGKAAAEMWANVGAMGASLMVGGVIQLLSPQPKAPNTSDHPSNQPSYVFNGAVNTQAQGNPVPLLYGRLIVGSAVISAGINSEDYAPATTGIQAGALLSGRRPKNFYEPL